ncbi:pleckstrin homology (PH) domain containing [Cryptosporidium xiaoi]|uniref:Pleckstrin homology (PH) domain containing n=1 Tax=Cryptosporidium xiaoi TaxID=659607 RepID=A0AAV9Y3M7_9CRYT
MDYKNNHGDRRSHSIISYRFETRAASIVQDLIEKKYVSGYLKKWSPVIGRGWQNRYFSLLENDRTLVYWKKKPTYKDEQPLGSINLKIVENIFADGPLGITLSTPQRDYQLRASTPTEKDKWMDAIILWTIKSRKYRSKTEDLKNFRFSNMLIESTQSCLNYIFESFLKPYKKSAIRAPEVGPETLSNSNKKKFLKDRGIYYVLYKAWLVSKEIRDERRNMNSIECNNNSKDYTNNHRQNFCGELSSNDINKNTTGDNYLYIKDSSELNSRSISMYSLESDPPSREKLSQQNLSLFKTRDGTVMVSLNTNPSNEICTNIGNKVPFSGNSQDLRRLFEVIQCNYDSSNIFGDVPTRPAENGVSTRSQTSFNGLMESTSDPPCFLVKEGLGRESVVSNNNGSKDEIKVCVEGKTPSVTWDIDDVFVDEGDEIMVPISSKYCIYDEGCPITVEEEEEYSRSKQHEYSLQLTGIMLEQLRTPQKELFLDNCIFGLVYITRSNPEMSSLKNSGIYWGLMMSSRSLGEAHHAYPSPILGERIIFGDSLECYRDIDLGLLLKSKQNNDRFNECIGNDLQKNKYYGTSAYSMEFNEGVTDGQTHASRGGLDTDTCRNNFVFVSSGTNNVNNNDCIGFSGLNKTSSYRIIADYNKIDNRGVRTDNNPVINDRKSRLKKIPKTFDHRYEINNTLVSSIRHNLINNIFPVNIGGASGEGSNVGFSSIFRPIGNNRLIDPYGFLLDTLYLYHSRNESKNPIYMLDPGKIISIGPISESTRGFTFTVTFMGSPALEDEIACDLEYINDSPSNVPFCNELIVNSSYEYKQRNNHKYHSQFRLPSNDTRGNHGKFNDTNSYICHNFESQTHIPHVSNSTLTPNSSSNSNSNAVLSNFIVNSSSYTNGGGGVSSYATAIETLSNLHTQTQNSSSYTKDDLSIYNNNFQLQNGNGGGFSNYNCQPSDGKGNWSAMSSYNEYRRVTIEDRGECYSIGDNSSVSNYFSEPRSSETLVPITIEFCTRSWRDARAWRYSLIVVRKSRLVDSMSVDSNKKTHSNSCSSSGCSTSISNNNSSSVVEQKSSTGPRGNIVSGRGRYANTKDTCTKERQCHYFDSCPTLTTTASSSARTSNGHHLINYRREISNIRIKRH